MHTFFREIALRLARHSMNRSHSARHPGLCLLPYYRQSDWASCRKSTTNSIKLLIRTVTSSNGQVTSRNRLSVKLILGWLVCSMNGTTLMLLNSTRDRASTWRDSMRQLLIDTLSVRYFLPD